MNIFIEINIWPSP